MRPTLNATIRRIPLRKRLDPVWLKVMAHSAPAHPSDSEHAALFSGGLS